LETYIFYFASYRSMYHSADGPNLTQLPTTLKEREVFCSKTLSIAKII